MSGRGERAPDLALLREMVEDRLADPAVAEAVSEATVYLCRLDPARRDAALSYLYSLARDATADAEVARQLTERARLAGLGLGPMVPEAEA